MAVYYTLKMIYLNWSTLTGTTKKITWPLLLNFNPFSLRISKFTRFSRILARGETTNLCQDILWVASTIWPWIDVCQWHRVYKILLIAHISGNPWLSIKRRCGTPTPNTSMLEVRFSVMFGGHVRRLLLKCVLPWHQRFRRSGSYLWCCFWLCQHCSLSQEVECHSTGQKFQVIKKQQKVDLP